MKMRLLFHLGLIVMLSLPNSHAIAQMEAANEAYQANDFNKAADLYEEVLTKGMYSESLYYNLGNSYYRTGQLGKAVLNYNRALLIDPYDEDTLHNLEVVQGKLVDQIESLPTFFLARWWKSSYQMLSSNVWGILGILAIWGGMIACLFWILGRTRTQKKWGFLTGAAILMLSILFLALGYSRKNHDQNSGYAVIMTMETELKSAPDEDSKALITLHEGTTVSLEDQIGEWYKIRLNDGEEGWLPLSVLEIIKVG